MVIRTEWWWLALGVSSLIPINAYISSPQCDLGVGEEWLPKHSVIKPQTAFQPTWMRYDGDDDDNDEF